MMKNLSFLILLIGCTSIVQAQYSSIGHRSESFFDSTRIRTITCDIYYPADISGNNVAVVSDTFHFPVLVFGHGFVMSTSSYATLRDSLVLRGYVMALPTTESGFSPSHLDFGKDLAFVAEQIQNSNSNSADLFYDRIANTSCVMGHSMGGGASFLSVPYYSGITAIANLSAAETNPSAISAASGINIPALLIAGENDCITPPASNQELMYNALPTTCKNLITINGASHCQMGDANFNCSIGEATCSPAPTISREFQQEKVLGYLSLWLDAVLKQNCQSGIAFETLRNSDTTITYTQYCNLCSSTSVTSSIKDEFDVYPNPFTGNIMISFRLRTASSQINVFDVYGRLVLTEFIGEQQNVELNLSELDEGIHILRLQNEKKVSEKIIVKN